MYIQKYRQSKHSLSENVQKAIFIVYKKLYIDIVFFLLLNIILYFLLYFNNLCTDPEIKLWKRFCSCFTHQTAANMSYICTETEMTLQLLFITPTESCYGAVALWISVSTSMLEFLRHNLIGRFQVYWLYIGLLFDIFQSTSEKCGLLAILNQMFNKKQTTFLGVLPK